jgi:hypothetical protein
MMEIFQHVYFRSFGSHAFMLITVEILCFIFQPISFSFSFTSKYIKAYFRHMRFIDLLHWKVNFLDLSCRTDDLAAWLH